MLNVTLKQFRYFEALARQGHFGRAAETSGISQPALSMQIKELEDTLGTALFERSARQVRLTAFGEEFRHRARQILRAVDELGDLARAAQDRFVGRLRLGVIPTIAPYLLPQVIGRISAHHPELNLFVRETVTPKLIAELSDGRLDAAIVALPVSEPALHELPLFREAFVLVRPLADAELPIPDGQRLGEMELLLLEEGHCFRDQALDFCRMRRAQPRDGLDGSSLSTLVQMVGAGIGVTLIPQMAVALETRSAQVALARFPAPEPAREVGLVWRRSSPLSEQLGQIGALVREAAGA